MKSLDGSIRTGDGITVRGFCKLIFDEYFLLIKWPSIVGYEEKVFYTDLETIYHSRFYGRVKIVYYKKDKQERIKQESIVFLSTCSEQKQFFLSSEVQNKIKQYSIDFIEYSIRNKSYSNIVERIKFWRYFG